MNDDSNLKLCVDCIYCSKETGEFTCDNPGFIHSEKNVVDGSIQKEFKKCSELRKEEDKCGNNASGFVIIKKSLATLMRRETMFYRMTGTKINKNIESVYYYQSIPMEVRHSYIKSFIKKERDWKKYLNNLGDIKNMCENKIKEFQDNCNKEDNSILKIFRRFFKK